MIFHLFWPINAVTMSDTRVNNAKASHTEVDAFGSEPCRLFQLALHAVLYNVFFCDVKACCTFLHQLCAHSAVPAPSPALLRHSCVLLSASWITVNTLFKVAPIKCFLRVNEGQLTLFISCGFIPCGFICFLNMSTWAALTAKLPRKDRMFLWCVGE